MTTNLYFDPFTNGPEQLLVEDLVIESIQMYGVDIIYLPRNTISRDNIFGEDIETKFGANYMVEIYIANIADTGAADEMLTKFGLQMPSSSTFIISKRRFNEVILNQEKPEGGDLIYIPLFKGLYEINYANDVEPFLQLGTSHTWTMHVELFTKSDEVFDTGVKAIDTLNNNDIVGDSDNKEIQTEADEFLEKSSTSNYINTSDDNRWGSDDVFNGL